MYPYAPAPGTFNVQSSGAISEAGGGILDVGTLTGSSAGATSLGNSNTVTDLSTFTVGSNPTIGRGQCDSGGGNRPGWHNHKNLYGNGDQGGFS